MIFPYFPHAHPPFLDKTTSIVGEIPSFDGWIISNQLTPLVIYYITEQTGKSPFLIGKTTINCHLSIAMLVYQRVNHLQSHNFSEFGVWTSTFSAGPCRTSGCHMGFSSGRENNSSLATPRVTLELPELMVLEKPPGWEVYGDTRSAWSWKNICGVSIVGPKNSWLISLILENWDDLGVPSFYLWLLWPSNIRIELFNYQKLMKRDSI